MALICILLATLALLAAANAQGTLPSCDDCCTSATALSYGTIYMDGRQFGAFSVCSNGYILLLRNTGERVRPYSFNPSPISQTEGSPLIAGFWADINLRCSGTNNAIRYAESCDSAFMWKLQSSIQDSQFTPTRALVVDFDEVQRYTCPSSRETNSFTITVASDPASCRSYLILDYQNMGWERATSYSSPPTVGYSNGQCQGFQASLGSNPATFLNQCRRLIYRIDQGFTQAQVNRGNLALTQQQDKGAGAVFMQQKDGDSAAMMENKLNEALQKVAAVQQSDVIMQRFEEKN